MLLASFSKTNELLVCTRNGNTSAQHLFSSCGPGSLLQEAVWCGSCVCPLVSFPISSVDDGGHKCCWIPQTPAISAEGQTTLHQRPQGQGEEEPLLSWRLGQRPLAGEQIKNLCDQGHISILEANKGREPRLVWPKKSGRESCLMHRRGRPAFVPNQLKTS